VEENEVGSLQSPEHYFILKMVRKIKTKTQQIFDISKLFSKKNNLHHSHGSIGSNKRDRLSS